MDVTVFSPAKINLFLAVTGRRADGFHDLVSVAAPLDFGDELKAETGGRRTEAGGVFSLECDQAEVPADGSNLVLKAAEAFANATGWRETVRFKLTKRIPMGAGLGGGSSNAVAALRALNRLSGDRLEAAGLERLAAGLGSDCVLFLRDAPVVMRGRGERVELLPVAATERLRGRSALLFKPGFGISTPWAYGRMVARGTDYLPAPEAETKLAAWLGGAAPAEELLFNNMEPAAFEKYLALPVLLEKLRREFGVAAAMSGSGSTCYALLRDGQVTSALIARIRELWGTEIFMREARLA
ncbi:4-(cytidine 5'-diphospho)-2-C-methyl-D-erythritol kinase [Oleiharenicola lentus]|jgi:4-diphosphocytidyl-2-C-methyl-D-erythritol kinase|uniref:4-diphosphocytidyl-2-C-methyl-D-erythritol kinase n=1 Tax=Oleiharenicola lentus TaxID=2508720 RepID=A0A4Q1C4F5_9BACT|nr:4-(cytidine 5'-diphospho)-2-C-methyl-D-erythritol kinase [Oleiharenicola lentus]RXK53251.1 4-(cytidine 5'-diphospho)-2-C-methyl-D-erythritol kinase [Oleiharenicola lentus]